MLTLFNPSRNPTPSIIKHLLHLRPALDRLIRFKEKIGLAGFTLNDHNWLLLERLQEILSIFVVVTTRHRASWYPTLQYQLPSFTIFLKHLLKEEKAGVLLVLSNAFEEGWSLLNEYWKKTRNDSSQVIAMMLDPRLKLATPKHLGLGEDWIRKSNNKPERLYLTDYPPSNSDTATNTSDIRGLSRYPGILSFQIPRTLDGNHKQRSILMSLYVIGQAILWTGGNFMAITSQICLDWQGTICRFQLAPYHPNSYFPE